ncbi:nucleotide pyrophosphohydrolase [Paenibacillus darwinianus]|uniref:Nucleotide pyrophosphohydrolase n=1 Tax=Paenibacillus darwinianus TaxID=1380763 RepID=A0A9W5S3C5_9BACL|nr:nucleotide pyrophosphohydrolase [Paenibacillus darwinianus]EXX92119.1 nucleotide pyrophosphohydrolase [Paenibacillus darwinianus]
MAEKTLADVQREVDAYISQFKEGYFSPLASFSSPCAFFPKGRITGSSQIGPKPKKPDEADNSIELELGDILFIITCFANSLEIDLARAHDKVMHKFNTRDAGRWTKKEGP